MIIHAAFPKTLLYCFIGPPRMLESLSFGGIKGLNASRETLAGQVCILSHAGRKQIAVHHARVDGLSFALRLDAEVGKPVEASFVRAVENFPVAKTAGAVKPDAAGSDAADGKADFPAVIAGVFFV